MHFVINSIIIILLLSIAGFFVFLIREKVKNTLWYRTRQVFKYSEKRKKEEQELLEKYEDHISEEEKKQMIHELRKKGNIKIPYAAFDYIYRHIDEFGIISKDGKIILTDEKAYQNIISKTNRIEYRFGIKNKDNKLIPKTNFDIQEGKNGAVSIRDFANNTITVETSKGDIYIANGRNMVTYKHKEEEKKNDNKKNKQTDNSNSTTTPKQNKNVKNDLPSETKEQSKNKQDTQKEAKRDNQSVEKMLETKALEALKQQQSTNKKSKKQESKKDDLESFNIDDLVKEMDNGEFSSTNDTNKEQESTTIDKEKNKIDTTESKIEETVLEEENEKIAKTYDNGFTLKNFFQRKLYFRDDLESFYGSLQDKDIIDFLIDLFTFVERYCQYPAIVKDDNSIYIDSSLFFISMGKNIKKDNEDDFIKKLISANKINMQNAASLLKAFNTILSNRISNEVFKIWENQDGGEICITKRSFEHDDNNFTSLMVILDEKTLNSLKIDTGNVAKVELQDKIRGAKMLGKAIMEKR